MKTIQRAIARLRVKLMPVRDYASWVRKVEAMEAIC